jgi:tubulin-folding cofactor B
VRYVGRVPDAAPGWFIGIELDEPVGKNNGSVRGVRYFECPANYGLFARPT